MKLIKKLKIGYILSFIVILGVFGLGIYLIIPGTTGSKYGDRLEGIDKISFTKKDQDKIVKKVKENEKVTSAKVNVKGRIINVIYNVNNETTLDEARAIAEGSLEAISGEVKEYYDIQYMISKKDEEGTKEVKRSEDGTEEEIVHKDFPIMGYKNIKSSKIVW